MSVRVGTCSWADDSLSKLWYPPGVSSAEARLRYYAEHFDTVEVNSSYYALPTEEMADRLGASARRPASCSTSRRSAMMTRHPVRVEQLPPDLRSEAEFDERGRVEHPSQELRAEVFRRFLPRGRAAARGRQAGRGADAAAARTSCYKPESLAYLEWAREQLHRACTCWSSFATAAGYGRRAASRRWRSWSGCRPPT